MIATPVPATDAPVYSTLAVSRTTGIPATTILAWERRYGLLRPHRDGGGRRVYSQADVELLLAMRARTTDGVRAEMAARELLAVDGLPMPTTRPRLVYLPTDINEVGCLHCGETSGELQLQSAPDGPLARFVLAPGAVPPRRGPGNRPRCGRCDGDLFVEARESRTLPPFLCGATQPAVQGAA